VKIKSFQLLSTATCLTFAGAIVESLPARAAIISTSSGQVQNVDVATGATSAYSNSNVVFGDIALSDTNNLFGVSFPTSELYSIAPGPGGATLIGSLGAFVNGLGFDDTNTLYGTGSAGFYRINTTTGSASQIGANIPDFRSSGDIAFSNATGKFFALSVNPTDTTLFSIATDGTAAPIGSVGFGSVFGLAFENGSLYGYTANGQQLTIDPLSGLGTLSLNVAGTTAANASSTVNIFGSASSNSASTTVPEPFTIVGTLIGGGAALRMRKKLKATSGG
jgi:hypothetical protein